MRRFTTVGIILIALGPPTEPSVAWGRTILCLEISGMAFNTALDMELPHNGRAGAEAPSSLAVDAALAAASMVGAFMEVAFTAAGLAMGLEVDSTVAAVLVEAEVTAKSGKRANGSFANFPFG